MSTKAMQNEFIFYGASQYAQKNLETWLVRGIIPICFSDADKSKHHKKIRPRNPEQTEFDVLPFNEAIRLYPDADVFVTINAEADPETFTDICNYIVNQGIAPERVGPIPEVPTGRPCIFYGAGMYASMNLKQWVFNGIVPACFADSNEQKHFTKIRIPPVSIENEFEILPVQEALERYPRAFLYITTSPETYDSVYDGLIAEGVPAERIGAPSQHCRHIGHQFLLKDPLFSYCCEMGYCENLPVVGTIKEDLEKYFLRCEQLRADLNDGKLTSCTGCSQLRSGRSDEELRITTVILDSGVPGATKCNFKCSYCFHGMNFKKKTHERSENVLQILQYLDEHEDIHYLSYAAAEISVSPYKHEVLELLKKKNWKGAVLTNAFIYIEELRDLLSEKNFRTTISIDSGTPETFAKVKGVNGFERVVENLEQYASSGGLIELKYIVLDGINCEKADLDGFIEIAEKINATVIISWDMRNAFAAYSDIQYGAVLYLAKQCIERNLPYSFAFDTPEYMNKLGKDSVYPPVIQS